MSEPLNPRGRCAFDNVLTFPQVAVDHLVMLKYSITEGSVTKEISLLKKSVEDIAKSQEAIASNEQKISRYLKFTINHDTSASADTCTNHHINPI